MKNKTSKILAVALVVTSLFVAALFWLPSLEKDSEPLATPAEKIHIHAIFHVYVDGALQDFSGLEYMNIKPCSEEPEEYDPAEEQYEKAHLHDYVGEVVHVHRAGAMWGDLFTNLGVRLASPSAVYVDGVEVTDIMNTEIKADTRVLIMVGRGDAVDEKLAALPSVDLIREVENNSESCGD
jgi:hypothetical protein